MIIYFDANVNNTSNFNTTPSHFTNYFKDPIIIKKYSKLKILNLSATINVGSSINHFILHSEDFKNLSTLSCNSSNNINTGMICLVPGIIRSRGVDTNPAVGTLNNYDIEYSRSRSITSTPYIHINNVNDISLNSLTFTLRQSNGQSYPTNIFENLSFGIEFKSD